VFFYSAEECVGCLNLSDRDEVRGVFFKSCYNIHMEKYTGIENPIQSKPESVGFEFDSKAPIQEKPVDSAALKKEKSHLLQQELAEAEKNYREVHVRYDTSSNRYYEPYYRIARDEIKSKVTTEDLRTKIEESSQTEGSKQEAVSKFIQEQNRKKAEGEASENIARVQKEAEDMNAGLQKYEKLVSDRETEMESIRQERLAARKEAEADPSNTEATRKSENLRMQIKDVGSEYHRLADKLDELRKKSDVQIPNAQERLRVWQEKKADIEKHPEAYGVVPKSVEEDPDFADALKAAQFAESEDEEVYRVRTGYDEQKAAREIFSRRFPEKWGFYQGLNTKTKQPEKEIDLEQKTATDQKIKPEDAPKNESISEKTSTPKEEPKLSPEDIKGAYKKVYDGGTMQRAFESLASRAYPDRRTYTPNSPQSQSVFETVLTRNVNSLSQLEELVALEFDRRNKNQGEIDDLATPDYRRKMLEGDAVISGQMDSGIENLARTLFNQEIDLNKYRKPPKEKIVEKPREPEFRKPIEDTPKPEIELEKKPESEPVVSAEKEDVSKKTENIEPQIQEAFKSNEFIRDHIVTSYLSYQDAELPDEAKRQMLEWSKSEESPKKYAEAIEQMAQKESLNGVQEKARGLTQKMLAEAKKIGLPVSPYGKSNSWAMWDLGKQFWYFTHQDQADPKYEIEDPLLSEKKQEEIINRHIGWEAYAVFNSSKTTEWKSRIMHDQRSKKALELLNKRPNAKRTLSSKDLADLGILLRTLF